MKRNEKKPLGCGICPYKTNSACHLERHLRIHTGQKPYACEMCSYRATDGGLLKRHMRIHSGEKPFICHICGHKTAQSCSLKDHMAVHTGKKRYSCDLCSFQCSRIGRLRDHQRVHKIKTECTQEDFPRDEAPVPSSNEPREPKNDVDLVLHKCSHCSLEFSEVQYLDRHVTSIHSAGSAKPVQMVPNSPVDDAQVSTHFCSLCSTPQESAEALESHTARHILYKCLKCKSIFETSDELTAHGSTHTNELMFDCNFCDFKCRTRNELRGHGRIHSTQQFKCSTCDFESKSAIEFSQHLMTHTMEEIVICHICSQKFRKTEELRDHMVSHYTRVRTRSVRKINELKLDNSKEVVGDSYSCFYCSFKCPEEREVEKHISDVHVSPTLSTQRTNDTDKFTGISCHHDHEVQNRANNSMNANRLSQVKELHSGCASLNVSSGSLLSGHQPANPTLAGFSKTVSQQMYHRAFYINNLYSKGYRECRRMGIPSSSLWNHGYAGHYLDKQSVAYSMNQCRNVQQYSDSSGMIHPPNSNPSVSIMQSHHMYGSLPLRGYLTHINHNFNMQTVGNEHSSALGMGIIKSEGMSLTQDVYDSANGIHQRRGIECDIFPVENERSQDTQNTAKRQLQREERIGRKQLVTIGKSREVASEMEDIRLVSKTSTAENSQSELRLKHENSSVNLLPGGTGTGIANAPRVTEDLEVPCASPKSVQIAATNVSGKVRNDSLIKDENLDIIGESSSGSTEGASGVKRKKIESAENMDRRVRQNSNLRRQSNSMRDDETKINDFTSINTVKTPQSVSTASGEEESPGDILLSKLRKFFNESFPKCDEASSNGNACQPAADDTVASSAIFTIDLSSDNETTDSN